MITQMSRILHLVERLQVRVSLDFNLFQMSYCFTVLTMLKIEDVM